MKGLSVLVLTLFCTEVHCDQMVCMPRIPEPFACICTAEDCKIVADPSIVQVAQLHIWQVTATRSFRSEVVMTIERTLMANYDSVHHQRPQPGMTDRSC